MLWMFLFHAHIMLASLGQVHKSLLEFNKYYKLQMCLLSVERGAVCVCRCASAFRIPGTLGHEEEGHFSHMMSSLGSAAEPGLGPREGSSYYLIVVLFPENMPRI